MSQAGRSSSSSLRRGALVVVRRLGHAVFLLVAVITLIYGLLQLAPGDAAVALAAAEGSDSPEYIEALRVEYGLDKPFPVQVATYIGNIARGDFGDSFFFRKPVSELILDRLWPTVLLVGTALTMALIGGVLLGVYSARRPTKASSHVVTIVALFGFSAPIFWTGIMLLLLFSARLGWLPSHGMESVVDHGTGLSAVWDTVKHLILPASTLGFFYMAQYSRISRATMLEVLGSDYVRTARAKGLRERAVVWKHALRNAVIPVVTIVGFQIAAILSGGILVETVFEWPGMGRLAFEAVLRRDTPVLMGILVVSTIIVIGANILTDIMYRVIDPRIRFATAA